MDANLLLLPQTPRSGDKVLSLCPGATCHLPSYSPFLPLLAGDQSFCIIFCRIARLQQLSRNWQSPSNLSQLGIQSGCAFLAKPHGVLESVQIHWDQEVMQLKWEKGYSGATAANSFVLTISLSLLCNQHLNQSSHIGPVQYQKGTVLKMANRV